MINFKMTLTKKDGAKATVTTEGIFVSNKQDINFSNSLTVSEAKQFGESLFGAFKQINIPQANTCAEYMTLIADLNNLKDIIYTVRSREIFICNDTLYQFKEALTIETTSKINTVIDNAMTSKQLTPLEKINIAYDTEHIFDVYQIIEEMYDAKRMNLKEVTKTLNKKLKDTTFKAKVSKTLNSFETYEKLVAKFGPALMNFSNQKITLQANKINNDTCNYTIKTLVKEYVEYLQEQGIKAPEEKISKSRRVVLNYNSTTDLSVEDQVIVFKQGTNEKINQLIPKLKYEAIILILKDHTKGASNKIADYSRRLLFQICEVTATQEMLDLVLERFELSRDQTQCYYNLLFHFSKFITSENFWQVVRLDISPSTLAKEDILRLKSFLIKENNITSTSENLVWNLFMVASNKNEAMFLIKDSVEHGNSTINNYSKIFKKFNIKYNDIKSLFTISEHFDDSLSYLIAENKDAALLKDVVICNHQSNRILNIAREHLDIETRKNIYLKTNGGQYYEVITLLELFFKEEAISLAKEGIFNTNTLIKVLSRAGMNKAETYTLFNNLLLTDCVIDVTQELLDLVEPYKDIRVKIAPKLQRNLKKGSHYFDSHLVTFFKDFTSKDRSKSISFFNFYLGNAMSAEEIISMAEKDKVFFYLWMDLISLSYLIRYKDKAKFVGFVGDRRNKFNKKIAIKLGKRLNIPNSIDFIFREDAA